MLGATQLRSRFQSKVKPEFMVLTRHSAQQLPTHHTVRKSRLLIYDLTYLGQANAVSTQCLHYDLTVF